MQTASTAQDRAGPSGRPTLAHATIELLAAARGYVSDMADLVAAEGRVAADGFRAALVLSAIGAMLLGFGAVMLLAFIALTIVALGVPVLVALGGLVVVSFAVGLFLLWRAKQRATPELFPATRRQLRID